MNFLKKLLFKKTKTTEPKEYILYYRKLCHDCDKVRDYMADENIDFNYFDYFLSSFELGARQCGRA
jgi:hypothetical protein